MSTAPSRVLSELTQQHAALRALMDRCEQLAEAFDTRGGDATELARVVEELRSAFAAHNAFEEQVLRPVLLEMDAFGGVRIDHMVDDHVVEHRAVEQRLGGPTGELHDAIVQLRVHLEAEERYFLTSAVLRDDTVTVEGGA
jgi:iron-sulfur cluster repair protein YtfE (RIC family)